MEANHMANGNTEKKFSKKIADHAWHLIKMDITYRENIFRNNADPTKDATLGFCDITVDRQGIVPKVDGKCPPNAIEVEGVCYAGIPGDVMSYQDIKVRLAKDGGHHLGVPGKYGKDGKWYSTYFFLTAELRSIFTHRTFLLDAVKATIVKVKDAPVQTQGNEPGESPYQDDETPAETPAEDASPFQEDEAAAGPLDELKDSAEKAFTAIEGGLQSAEELKEAKRLVAEAEAANAS
jgi:hypothetical protein